MERYKLLMDSKNKKETNLVLLGTSKPYLNKLIEQKINCRFLTDSDLVFLYNQFFSERLSVYSYS